ncbi:unnamed protein product [Natator depressus]
MGAGAAAGPVGIRRRCTPRGPGPGRLGAGGGLPGCVLSSLLHPGQLGQELWLGGRGLAAGELPPTRTSSHPVECGSAALSRRLPFCHASVSAGELARFRGQGGRAAPEMDRTAPVSVLSRGALVLNQLVLSMLWYRLNTLVPAPDFLANLRKLILEFFWSGLHWVSAGVLHLPLEEGGQGLKCLRTQVHVFPLQALQRLLYGAGSPAWSILAHAFLRRL